MLTRIAVILSALHAAQEIEGMDVPTFRLYGLKGVERLLRCDCPRELADHFSL
jgi:hypothetical protein